MTYAKQIPQGEKPVNIKTFTNQAREAASLLIDSFTPTGPLPLLHKLADLASDAVEGFVFALHSNQAADELWDWTTSQAQKAAHERAADRLAEAEAEEEVWPGPEPEKGHSLTLDDNLSAWKFSGADYAGTDAPWSRTETTANPTQNTTPKRTDPQPFAAQTNQLLEQILDILTQISFTQISSAVRAQPTTGLDAAAAPAEDAPPPHHSPVGVGHPNQQDETLKMLLLTALLKKATADQ